VSLLLAEKSVISYIVVAIESIYKNADRIKTESDEPVIVKYYFFKRTFYA